ncbi:unnamed protein product [Mytilus edulis]|uniref:Uncharacterized protein n=1 Tax=Mytilus edulis TaxID=6550 RepID=A0A8S3QHM5_MYTED|nr:unnamed protein product [Mytilus edulis]
MKTKDSNKDKNLALKSQINIVKEHVNLGHNNKHLIQKRDERFSKEGKQPDTKELATGTLFYQKSEGSTNIRKTFLAMEKHQPDYEHWKCRMCKRKFIRRKYLYLHLKKTNGLDKVKSIRMAIESTRDDKNQQPPYYGDISEDDTIIDLTDELDFNDT